MKLPRRPIPPPLLGTTAFLRIISSPITHAPTCHSRVRIKGHERQSAQPVDRLTTVAGAYLVSGKWIMRVGGLQEVWGQSRGQDHTFTKERMASIRCGPGTRSSGVGTFPVSHISMSASMTAPVRRNSHMRLSICLSFFCGSFWSNASAISIIVVKSALTC